MKWSSALYIIEIKTNPKRCRFTVVARQQYKTGTSKNISSSDNNFAAFFNIYKLTGPSFRDFLETF